MADRARKQSAAKTRSEAGATPPCRRIAAPVPAGFGGHSRLFLLEDAARVLAAQEKGISDFVRQHVRRDRKGGTKRKHGNHQGTTQATKVSDDPGAS